MAREDLRRTGRAELAEIIFAACGGRVLDGPFKGLQYVTEAVGSGLLPKLLGTYERELHPTIEAAIARDYDSLIDVGAAEGYYAVGFAYRCPRLQVYAFDPDPLARRLCRSLALLNSVSERVRIGGNCSPDRLATLARGRALVISDCEGFEEELFSGNGVDELRLTDLIVETHDHVSSGVTDRLIDRFGASHRVERLEAQPRTEPPASIGFLDGARARLAMDERRPPAQTWLVMSALQATK